MCDVTVDTPHIFALFHFHRLSVSFGIKGIPNNDVFTECLCTRVSVFWIRYIMQGTSTQPLLGQTHLLNFLYLILLFVHVARVSFEEMKQFIQALSCSRLTFKVLVLVPSRGPV